MRHRPFLIHSCTSGNPGRTRAKPVAIAGNVAFRQVTHQGHGQRFLAAARVALAALLMSSAAHAGDSVETSGEILRVALPVTAFALTYVYDDPDGRPQFYKSFAANVAATLLLKEVISKDRPDGSDDDALPSGHTSMAFQGASFIQRRYGLKAGIPAYLLAAYTGWTRLDADEHDEADVLAGAAVGIASSLLFVDRFENLDVAVRLDRQIGIQFSGRF